MKNLAVALVVGAWCGVPVFAGTWQSVSSIWDGDFSNTLHWSGGIAADGAENQVSSASAPGQVTVTVNAATETTGKLNLNAASSKPVVLDVTGQSILFATQTVENATWPANAFYGRFDGYSFFNVNSDDSRWNKQASAKLADVSVKIHSPEAGVAEMLVKGGANGVFDFVHPDPRGDTKASNGARPTVTLSNANYYQPAVSGFNRCRFVFEDVTGYLPSLTFASHPTVGELSLDDSTLNLFGNVSLNCTTNLITMTGGSTLDVTAGSWSQVAPNNGTTVFSLGEHGVLNTKGITIADNRHVVVEGGRIAPAQKDMLTIAGTSVLELRNASFYKSGEVAVTLSANGLLTAENCALTNDEKFTTKVLDSAKVVLKGGTLNTPLMAGAERSRFEFDGVEIAVNNFGLTHSRVTMTDCTFSPVRGLALSGTDGEYVISNATGSTAADQTFYISGSNTVTFTGDRLDRTLIVNSYDHAKLGQNGFGELNLEGGTLEFRPRTGSMRLNLAHGSKTDVGILNVKGGRLVSKVTTDGSTGSFGLGITHGTGFINVSGGEVDVAGLCICTEDSGNANESVFRQTGGHVKVAPADYQSNCQSKGLCATGNSKLARRARIALDGGVTEVSVIAGGTSGQCRGGTGWTAFEADGGTVKVNKTNAHILRDFDEAKLGAKGLTVDSDGYSATIAQNLASKPDVTGRLILTGTGTKTVSGTSAVEIVAAGGEVAFAAGADNSNVALVATNGVVVSFAAGGAKNRMFSSLVLGDATTPAIVQLKAGEPLTVTGDVTVNRLSLILSGTFTTGQSYSLLTCGGSISDDSKDAWRHAFANGLGADQGCDLDFEADGQGNTVLKMSVRERTNLTITVEPNATSNIAAGVTYSATETLTVDVGAAGTLNVTGRAGQGALVKMGTGRATFDNASDAFAGGVTVQAGLLAFPEASIFEDVALYGSALSVGTGTLGLGRAGNDPVTLVPTLTVNTTAAGDAAVVSCASDITATAPMVSQGCFVKRGAGTMTLETTGTCAFSSNAGKDVKNTQPHAAALSFDPCGVPPTDNYSALTVAEGDLVLSGTGGAKYTTSGLGAVYVGMPVTGIAKPARLVVDGVAAEFNGAHFHVGSSVRTANCSQPDSEFLVTNGANAQVTSLRLGWGKDADARPRVRVAGAETVLRVTEYLYLADGSSSAMTEEDPQLLVTDGAAALMPAMNDGNNNHAMVLRGGGLGVFDNALLAAKDKKEARVRADGTGTLVFRNGAECRVSEVRADNDSAGMELIFDNAKWSFGSQQTLSVTRPGKITVTARNEGLVFEPAAGTNLAFALSVSGTGGLVKRGAGSLTLSSAPTFTGVCRVEEGDLALGNDVTATGLTLAGAGRLTDGTFQNATLLAPLGDGGAVTGNVPVIAGAAFTGRTCIDLARSTPIAKPFPQNVRVATYTDAAPDVSQWKAVNGATDGVVAKFVAANGEIRMDLQTSGVVILFR